MARTLLVERLDRCGLASGARVLVLSRAPGDLPAALAARGFVPTALPPASPLAVSPRSFDGAIVVDALEHAEWDRWLLRQVRRALVPDAPLLVEARNLWSLATPWDALGLAGRIGGLLARKAWNAASQGAATGRRFRGRRYRGAPLAAMLERVGFVLESQSGGATGRARSLLARARSAPLVACDAFVPAFEREQADFVRARDAWLRAHPAHAPHAVERLEPAAYAGRTALVLAPLPGSEIVGLGGTIVRLARAGCRVACVQATDGAGHRGLRGLAEDAAIEEARGVARAAGIGETDFWRANGRSFHATEPMIARLAETIARLEPALVFTPFLADPHPDHRTINAILAGAILASGDALARARILGYEVWSLAPASVACDVSEVRDARADLLRAYEHAMRVDDFIELCERRSRYHACRLFAGAGHAEAFHAARPADYPALVASAYQTR